MIDVLSIYDDVTKDVASISQNGNITVPMFNRFSKRAELRLLDWLSGDPAGVVPPEPWATQKNKDLLSPFIKKIPKQVENRIITRPSDYYKFEDLYRNGGSVESGCCDDDDDEEDCDEKPVDDNGTTIELLDSATFNNRTNTYIKEDKPTLTNPIVKQVGRTFEFYPRDIGQVTLEYISYPVFASVKSVIDPLYNTEVAAAVKNYDWDEGVREPLIWFIVDFYTNWTREQALKQFNSATKKTVRE